MLDQIISIPIVHYFWRPSMLSAAYLVLICIASKEIHEIETKGHGHQLLERKLAWSNNFLRWMRIVPPLSGVGGAVYFLWQLGDSTDFGTNNKLMHTASALFLFYVELLAAQRFCEAKYARRFPGGPWSGSPPIPLPEIGVFLSFLAPIISIFANIFSMVMKIHVGAPFSQADKDKMLVRFEEGAGALRRAVKAASATAATLARDTDEAMADLDEVLAKAKANGGSRRNSASAD